ncbi:DUF4123 domain-containing protein [Enterovibrio sp. ZSDZ35]|uniref:DUF4123 domain-containing protein n=1 Tax=Enterovibrio qingdaonensis TaxID=2899818 RepID=A0ABT5QQG4_9GAMM|nr:DUF4123 domain-containing protein [Enterovibrio sp. ZSDZ35]MDD1783216.1 DUF4123 domain-containing protein [Enterovibrio sp. ZSDZ35]
MSETVLPKPFPDMDLHGDMHLYLILDGTQIPNVETLLYQVEGNPKYEPIYFNSPWSELKEVSPCVVVATWNLVDWFRKNANANQGYFFSSFANLEDVAETMRGVIQVKTPYGSSVFYKMAHAEAAWVLFDDESPALWHNIEQVWLPTRDGWKTKNKPSTLSSSPQQPITFTDKQWAQLGQISWRNSLEKIEKHITKWFNHSLPQTDNHWVREQASRAYQKGFSSERDLLQYFTVLGFLGEKALTEEAYPELYQLVNAPSAQTPSQRIEKAALLAERYATSTQEHTL